MNLEENDFKMTREEFRLIRDMLYEHCGVYHDDSDASRFMLEKRLSHSLAKNQLSSFADYYYMLKYDNERGPSEFTEMVNLLTIHETYFFREDRQLKCFQSEILPELYKRNEEGKRLKIWSAGCSTGEEPYSLAMIINDSGMFKNWDWEIIATDISPQVLSFARKGEYTASSFRVIDSDFQSYKFKYFRQEENCFHISDEIKKNITFFTLNLIDKNRLAFIPDVDLIICRNVIIYFTNEIKKQVINIFSSKLVNMGFLLMGHSEALIGLSTDFTLKHFKYDMLYQKERVVNGGL